MKYTEIAKFMLCRLKKGRLDDSDKFQLWNLVGGRRACAGILFFFLLSFLLLNNHRQDSPVSSASSCLVVVVNSIISKSNDNLSLLLLTNFVITFSNDNDKFWISKFWLHLICLAFENRLTKLKLTCKLWSFNYFALNIFVPRPLQTITLPLVDRRAS